MLAALAGEAACVVAGLAAAAAGDEFLRAHVTFTSLVHRVLDSCSPPRRKLPSLHSSVELPGINHTITIRVHLQGTPGVTNPQALLQYI